MSGIIGYIGNKRVVPVLLEGLQRLPAGGHLVAAPYVSSTSSSASSDARPCNTIVPFSIT